MLAEERFALILDLLARQRTATVQELCEALSASESNVEFCSAAIISDYDDS